MKDPFHQGFVFILLLARTTLDNSVTQSIYILQRYKQYIYFKYNYMQTANLNAHQKFYALAERGEFCSVLSGPGQVVLPRHSLRMEPSPENSVSSVGLCTATQTSVRHEEVGGRQ